MRFVGTGRSATADQMSLLALTETAVAISFGAFVAYTNETVFYILLSALLSPILLLRTEFSSQICCELFIYLSPIPQTLFERVEDWEFQGEEIDQPIIRKLLRLVILLFTLLYWLFLIVLVILISGLLRFASNLVGLVFRPLYTLSHIPANWRRVVFQTDVSTKPEIIPGLSDYLHKAKTGLPSDEFIALWDFAEATDRFSKHVSDAVQKAKRLRRKSAQFGYKPGNIQEEFPWTYLVLGSFI